MKQTIWWANTALVPVSRLIGAALTAAMPPRAKRRAVEYMIVKTAVLVNETGRAVNRGIVADWVRVYIPHNLRVTSTVLTRLLSAIQCRERVAPAPCAALLVPRQYWTFPTDYISLPMTEIRPQRDPTCRRICTMSLAALTSVSSTTLRIVIGMLLWEAVVAPVSPSLMRLPD